MRRILLLTAIVILTASVPLAAQHGGGHGTAGSHGGFSSRGSLGGGGHAAGGHSFAGGRSLAGGSSARAAYPRSYHSQSPYFRSGRSLNSRTFSHSSGVRIRTYGLRNYCYGYRCGFGYGYGYPYLGAGIDPYWWWDSGSYDQDQQNQIGLANEMNAQSLYDQRMREQSDQDTYAPSAPRTPQPVQSADLAPATVLVFRDQHKQEVKNYAIVGQTLWNFSAQRTAKIPLSDLDLPATTKANEDRGVDFRVPGGNEGQ